ncbi:MAG: mechanosensitive ion channel [Lachnospiraceae bacterium]|nr:mechanosensitive ion channel [Lachnospiraceae bacterium]
MSTTLISLMSKEELDAFFTTGVSGSIISLLVRILVTILIFFIGTKLIKFALRLVQKSMEKAKAEKGVITFALSFLRAAMYVVLIFIIASRLGVDAASIVALLGSAGVAIGLAIQGSLSNFAGGILILLVKPFKVGDYIIDASGREGTVSEIQIIYTKLQTKDNKVIILPNGNLANNSIINVTAENTRRIDIGLQISYGADMEEAKEVLMEMLSEQEYVLKEQVMRVVVDELQDSGVKLLIQCWVKGADYWTAKWDLTEKAKLTLDKNGIEIPFPQVDVHIRSGEITAK